MEIRIKERQETQMIGRIELRFDVVYEQAPPTRQQVREALGKELNVSPNLVVVRKMHDVFGLRKSVGTAHIYGDEINMKKYVSKYVLIRMGLAQKEVKQAAAPKAAVKKKLK